MFGLFFDSCFNDALDSGTSGKPSSKSIDESCFELGAKTAGSF